MNEIKFIELFAGIGGFRYGLENIGYETAYRQETTEGVYGVVPDNKCNTVKRAVFSCVYTNEFNKYAAQIYERHYEKPDTRDIREVSTNEIPDHDLLTAGFPCQSFSIAGKRGGFNDTRGTLFFEIARILKDKNPRLFLLENVKGLLSHDNGNTFKTIISTLDELGYDLQWQVLNSKNFGVPQNRERVFIVGHLRGTSRPEVFPFGSGNEINSEQNRQGNDLAHTLSTSDKHRGSYVAKWSKSKGRDSGKIRNEERFTIDGTVQTLSTGEGCFNFSSGNYVLPKIRRLTPTECERLQGFPDGWTESISDTQRYKCLGNAVTTNVITAIGERLQSLDKKDRE